MKTTFKHIAIIAALPLLCMCAKNDEINKGGKVTVTASIPDVKVSLTPGDDPALSLAWETTDQILIAGSTEETFSVKEVLSDAHMASFEGNAVSGSSFTVYYPADKGILTRSYANQTQDGNNSTAHLQFNAIAENLSSYDDIEFTKVNGAVKIQVKLPETVAAVSELSVTAMSEQKVAQNIFYATNDAEGAMTSTLTIKFDDAAVPDGDHVVTAYMMVSWNPVELAAGTLLQFEATASGKTCKYVKTIAVSVTNTIAGGETFIIDMSEAAALKHVIAGTGTQADPYLLYDAEDMVLMSSLLVADKVTYFKMMDDIDMEGIDWVGGNQNNPYKQHIDFDGNNKTISNLTCTKSGIYPGLVGVLSGRVANVTFENPDVTASKHAGIICGYAGSKGTNPAIVENVNIINGKVTQNSGNHSGLIFGHSNVNGCEFTNITVSGTIAQNGIGDSGFIGGAQNIAATFTNCHATGTLTLKSGLSATGTATNICTGGIQGFDGGSTYDGCSFSGTINGGRLSGGIVGYNQVAGVNISDCHVSNATIKSVAIGSAPGEVVGGIIAWVESGKVSKCSFEGTINAAGKEVGGIVGHVKAGNVEYCYTNADISGNTDVGGVVGFLAAGTSGSPYTISYCYSTGSVTNAGQLAGGIAGEIQGYNKVSYCFSTSKINALRGAGGVIGRASGLKWDVTTAYNDEVDNCHAFNSEIKSTQTAEGAGSGTVIGYCSKKDTYTNCYRHPAFGNNDATQTRFYCANEPNELPVDQGLNINASNPITAGIMGTTSAKGALSMKYTYPFHGNVADNDCDTMTKLATKLGWDTTIWNLSGDYPTLKNNPEPAK